jgi:putative transposase
VRSNINLYNLYHGLYLLPCLPFRQGSTGANEDVLHLLVGFNPDCAISDLVLDIKSNASKWINEKGFVIGKFEWQTGIGAFTIGQSQIDRVVKYITDQEEHHKIKTFREEYIDFLKAYQVEYKIEYTFNE